MPTILPLFDNGEIITAYLDKAAILNNYLPLNAPTLDTNDELPVFLSMHPLRYQ